MNQYNEHAKLLTEIGIEVLNGNPYVFNVNGIKEIIALYLLIPYITPDQLDPPEGSAMPQVTGEFCGGILLEDLRNTICHSFVTVEEYKNDGSEHGKYLIFDDRIKFHRRTDHNNLANKNECYCIYIEEIHQRLLQLFNEIKNA